MRVHGAPLASRAPVVTRNPRATRSNHPMKGSQPCSFVIEREVPNVGQLSRPELAALSRKSCAVLDQLGPSLQWIHSYVTRDKIYCIYSTDDADLIRRHAELGGFPANRISPIAAIIDPSTAAE